MLGIYFQSTCKYMLRRFFIFIVINMDRKGQRVQVFLQSGSLQECNASPLPFPRQTTFPRGNFHTHTHGRVNVPVRYDKQVNLWDTSKVS